MNVWPKGWWLSSQPAGLRRYVGATVLLAVGLTATVLLTRDDGRFHLAGVAGFCALAVAVALATPTVLSAFPGGPSFEDPSGVWILAALILWGPREAIVLAVLIGGVWAQQHDRLRSGITRETAKQVLNVSATVIGVDLAAVVIDVLGPLPHLADQLAGLAVYLMATTAVIAGVLVAAGQREIVRVFTTMSQRFVLLTEIPLGLGLAMAWRAEPIVAVVVAGSLVAAGAGQQAAYVLQEASIDRRTGLLRPDPWLGAVARLLARGPVGFLLIDVDHFKTVNDEHGHLVGDQVLTSVAELLRGCLRPGDLPARWGGEEFVVAVPGVSPDELMAVAGRVADAVRRTSDLSDHGYGIRRTVSVGCVLALRATPVTAPDAVRRAIAQADLAMYEAKAGGRDQVVTQEEPIRAA
jgi:diguanylate cyclase (GGDEF)-like protein